MYRCTMGGVYKTSVNCTIVTTLLGVTTKGHTTDRDEGHRSDPPHCRHLLVTTKVVSCTHVPVTFQVTTLLRPAANLSFGSTVVVGACGWRLHQNRVIRHSAQCLLALSCVTQCGSYCCAGKALELTPSMHHIRHRCTRRQASSSLPVYVAYQTPLISHLAPDCTVPYVFHSVRTGSTGLPGPTRL